MSCGCKELYCIHAWEAVRPEDFIPDSDLYAYADAHITQEPTWETLVMSKYNPKYIRPMSKISLTYAGPVSTSDPLAQEKASLFRQYDQNWSLIPGNIYTLRARDNMRTFIGPVQFTGYNYKQNTYEFMEGGTGWNTWLLQKKGFEIQLSDGSWYYPWPESDSGFEKEKQAEYSCAHKPVNIGFMSQKWVCAHCDAELDAETAIKLGGKV